MRHTRSVSSHKLEKEIFITSYCKKVKQECNSLVKGTSKLINRLFYFYLQNCSVGLPYVITSTKALAEYLDCHPSMISLYIKEAIRKGLGSFEKIRGKRRQHLWKFIPTEKLLNIKKCGSVNREFLPLSSELTSENPKSNVSQSGGIIDVLVPSFYLNINSLNNAQARETFSLVEKEKSFKDELRAVSVAEVSKPTRKVLTPAQRAAMKARKAAERANQLRVREVPVTSEEQAQALLALAYLKDFAQQHQLIKPLEIKDAAFCRTFVKRMRSHFGTIDNFVTYITYIATVPYLMGQKANADGSLFALSVGFILSPKMIEMYWEKKKYFDVWPEKPKEEDMARKPQPEELPALTLAEVLLTSQSRLDGQIKAKLYELLGEATYKSWIHANDFVAIGISNGAPEFEVANQFVVGMLQERFGQQLQQAFKV